MTDPEQQGIIKRLLGAMGVAVEPAVKSAIPPEPRAGGIEYNPISRDILNFIGVLPISQLSERRRRLFDNYSDNIREARMLEIVPKEIYKTIEGVTEIRESRGLSTNFKQLQLMVLEGNPPSPPPRPPPIRGGVEVWIEGKVIQHPREHFHGEIRTVSSPYLNSGELRQIFRPGRSIDEAEEEFLRVTMRREAEAIPPRRRRR
jgi:hypothetical protein